MGKYLSIEEMLDALPSPNRSACLRLFDDNKVLFRNAHGSTHNHQAWPGGYLDHVKETMNIAIELYETLDSKRPLPFSLLDALLVCFLHDLEKPWKYEVGPDGQLQHKTILKTKEAHHEFRRNKLKEYGVVLTPEQENGLKYVEGELDSYTNKKRVMGPLAAFCHLCDITSARIWYEYPSKNNDPWPGAKRIKDF